MRKLFPNTTMKWNHKEAALRFRASGYPMEFDIFVPSLQLAVEYQGESHFKPLTQFGGVRTLNEVRVRDEEKRLGCKSIGIALVEITYAWDRKQASVRQAIIDVGEASGRTFLR
jgi:hypothetical protein